MQNETEASYLSAMYYTAAVLLVFSAIFSAAGHNYRLAALWFSLGAGFFLFRLVTSRKPD